jgi:rhamnosyltransferase
MKILGHIHTFNDEDVIDQSLHALLDQTYPLQEILIVDNGSTDGTLDRKFPGNVTVVKHLENRGTSGAVVTGMQYAIDKGYDWIWLFDADSAPRKDALERLIRLYQSFSSPAQAEIRLLASLPVDFTDGRPYHGMVFGPRGSHPATPRSDDEYYECDGPMWTGSLFKVEALRRIGLPSVDYVLDEGEFEYGYRGRRSGYKAFMHQLSIVDHNIGGQTTITVTPYTLGPFTVKLIEVPPIRCYYVVRNTIFFWLYEYEYHNVRLLCRLGYTQAKFILNFLLRPITHRRHVSACFRGLRDGLLKRMHRRY